MGKIRRGTMQREHIPAITSEWVEQHRYILTPRDIAMMKLLTVFPIATVEHLYLLTPETFLPRGKRIAPFYENIKGRQICRDRVRKLFDYHFVNKHAPKLPLGDGTSPQYIWLDRAGYKLFGIEGRPNKQLTQEYMHHAKILDVYTLLVILERRGTISIDYISTCYADKPRTANIEPDLIVAFKKGKYGYKYFIEVDNCEKKEKEELGKLDRYRDWELGSQWIRESWASIYKRKFPVVLYAFSGQERKVSRRVKVFKEHAQEIECKADCIRTDAVLEKILSLPE